MNVTLDFELDMDGRWIAEVPQRPGGLAYGSSPVEAMAKAEIQALRIGAVEYTPSTACYSLTRASALPIFASTPFVSHWPSAKAKKGLQPYIQLDGV